MPHRQEGCHQEARRPRCQKGLLRTEPRSPTSTTGRSSSRAPCSREAAAHWASALALARAAWCHTALHRGPVTQGPEERGIHCQA